MPYEIGDILIVTDGSCGSYGHVAMFLNVTPDSVQIFQAGDTPGAFLLVWIPNSSIRSMGEVYRAPWRRMLPEHILERKRRLISVAMTLYSGGACRTVRYSTTSAIRLWIGSKNFDTGARHRVEKYLAQFNALPWLSDQILPGFGPFAIKNGDFIENVTCVSAILLCYQLTFSEYAFPFFPLLDPERTMPMSLREWLSVNWERVI